MIDPETSLHIKIEELENNVKEADRLLTTALILLHTKQMLHDDEDLQRLNELLTAALKELRQ